MSGLKRDMPTTTSHRIDIKMERKRLDKMLADASNAIDALNEIRTDLGFLKPQRLSDYKECLIKDAVGKKLEQLDNPTLTAILSSGELSFKRRRWEGIQVKALQNIGTIKALKKAYPSGKFTLADRGVVVCENADEIIEAKCSVSVPDEVRELFRLYATWHDSFVKLNWFARKNNFHQWKANEINNFDSPQAFLDAWMIGAFNVEPTPKQQERWYNLMKGGNL